MKKLIVKFNDEIIAQTQGAYEDLMVWLEGDKHKYPIDSIVEIWDYSYEFELADCIAKRVAEYPAPSDFLNAYFDGKEEALHDLELKRLAVKAKYPKPVLKEPSLDQTIMIVEQVTTIEENQNLPDFVD